MMLTVFAAVKAPYTSAIYSEVGDVGDDDGDEDVDDGDDADDCNDGCGDVKM